MIKKTPEEIKQDEAVQKWMNWHKDRWANGKGRRKKKRKQKPEPKKKLSYAEKLRHPKWYKRRRQIIKKDNGMCVRCGSKKELQVHHIRYIDGRDPWNYPDALLLTLCRDCHRKEHAGPDYFLL